MKRRMEANSIYYNISDTLHAARLKETLYDNAMTPEQANGVDTFLESLAGGTSVEGDLPIKIICIQGDAGTGKTQAIVSLCQILDCPIVLGSTNPSSVNVGERCRSAFPYASCLQAQLSGTVWAGLHWNIGSEEIGKKWEGELRRIYGECVRTKSAPNAQQDKAIYKLLNKMLFRKMREKFQKECEMTPQKWIYAAWKSARTGTLCFVPPNKAIQELYEMFCSVPEEEMTQEDFNAALAFRCLTAFTEILPRALLSNFVLIEEAARLPGYFLRIVAYYHYMVRYHIKPPGYRTSMLTICLIGSPLQSSVIKFPDYSVIDEAVLDAEKRNTHISVYTVNRRTPTLSAKAKALATVVHILENDCALRQEHCSMLEPFVVPRTSFMNPTFATSAMRLTHYHKNVIEFTDKANSLEHDVISFYEHIFVSVDVLPKKAFMHADILDFLCKKGPACLPYRSTRAKDIRNEGVLETALPVLVDFKEEESVTYRLFSMRRILGKNTPVATQHTARLTPVEFCGTYRYFYNSAAPSLSCSEHLWSLRIGLSFANLFCHTLSEEESYCMAIVIDNVWAKACQYAKEIAVTVFDNVEKLVVISACLTEAHEHLWQALVKEDSVGFLDLTLRVDPFYGTESPCFFDEEPPSFPYVFMRGDRFPYTLRVEDAVPLIASDIIAKRMKPGNISTYSSELCYKISKSLRNAVWKNNFEVHDLLLRAPSGILFRTVNLLVPERWSSVFPKHQFEWKACDDDHSDDCLAPKPKKAKMLQKQMEKKTVAVNIRESGHMQHTERKEPDNSEAIRDDAIGEEEDDYGDESEDGEQGEENPGNGEKNSIVHMLHAVYDSRVRTIDSVQGDTITCDTLVDVESIQTMGQLTVALTRNIDADSLMLTSSDITHIASRDPITKFVRLSARDTANYYVK